MRKTHTRKHWTNKLNLTAHFFSFSRFSKVFLTALSPFYFGLFSFFLAVITIRTKLMNSCDATTLPRGGSGKRLQGLTSKKYKKPPQGFFFIFRWDVKYEWISVLCKHHLFLQAVLLENCDPLFIGCHYACSFCNQIIIRSIICELLKHIGLDNLANLATTTLVIGEYFSTWLTSLVEHGANFHNFDCSSLIAAKKPPVNECCRFENPASSLHVKSTRALNVKVWTRTCKHHIISWIIKENRVKSVSVVCVI